MVMRIKVYLSDFCITENAGNIKSQNYVFFYQKNIRQKEWMLI
jgi:hypothetical protein